MFDLRYMMSQGDLIDKTKDYLKLSKAAPVYLEIVNFAKC